MIGTALAFVKSYRLILLAVAALAALGTLVAYIHGAEQAKAAVDTLTRERDQQAQAIAELHAYIDEQNVRIANHNQSLRMMVEIERNRTELARAAAQEYRQQRDRITAALSESRRQFETEVQTDETLAAFVALDVPGAVFERLRRATVEAGPAH